MKENIKTTLFDCNKQQAEKILKNHTNYRKPNKSRVQAYAKAMKEGSWKLSDIKFDENGNLVDGQHRLLAVIESDAVVKFAVITGWPSDSTDTLDNNQPRTKSQVVSAERGIKNGRVIMSLVTGMEFGTEPRLILNSEALSSYDTYGDIANEVYKTMDGKFKAAMHGLAFARAIIKYPNRKKEILEAAVKMCSFQFEEKRMSGLKLYSRLVLGFTHMKRLDRADAYMRCARGIIGYLNDEDLGKLCLPKEDPFKI